MASFNSSHCLSMSLPNPSELLSFILQTITAILLSVLVVQNISYRRQQVNQHSYHPHQQMSDIELHRILAAQAEAMECVWQLLREGLRDLGDLEGKLEGLAGEFGALRQVVCDLREEVEGLRWGGDREERREECSREFRYGRFGGRRGGGGEMRF